jgi:O-antigen/teichoic acid export membrane protein
VAAPVRQIFSDAVIYTIGSVFNRLLPFLLLPLYTLYFNPTEYGVFSLIYSFWFFAIVFYLYGMETSFQKFFIEAKTHDERRTVFSSTMLFSLVTSFIFSVIIFTLAGFISVKLTGSTEHTTLIKFLALLLVIDALYRFPMILINSLQKAKLYSTINAIAVVINVIVNVYLIVYAGLGIEAIFYSYIISYTFLLMVSFYFARDYFVFKLDLGKIKSLMKTAHLFLYYGLFLISIDLIDRFILEYFKGTAEVGIYSACYRIGIVMNLVITGFKVAWTPFFLHLKEDESNKEIFSKVFTYFCYGGLVAFLTFSLLADELVQLNVAGYTLLNEDYWGGLVIVPFILLAYLFSGLYLNLNVAAFFQNKIKYLIISSAAGCLSNIALNFILIPPYSMVGAAIATLLSYMIMFFVLYYISQRIYRINYDWKPIIKAAILTGALYFANIYIPNYLNLSYIYTIILEIISILILFIVLLGGKSKELLSAYYLKNHLK